MTTERYTTTLGEVIEYATPPPKVAAFLARAERAANDPRVSLADLTALIYGRENPILDQTIFPGRGAVTRSVLQDPRYAILADLISVKLASEGAFDGAAAAAAFTMSVTEASKVLEMTTSAVRQAIAQKKISAIKKGGSYLLDPASVEVYGKTSQRRGPKPMGSPPALEIRMGSVEGKSFAVKVADLEILGKQDSVIDARCESFERAAVKFTGKKFCRTFILEPAEEPNAYTHGPFYVRGRYVVAETINDPRKASEAFARFAP